MSKVSIFKEQVDKLVSFHQQIRTEFKSLIILSQAVGESSKDRPGAPRGISEFLLRFWITLEADMQNEERYIFPLILRENCSDAYEYIKEMTQEHMEQEEELRGLIKMVQEYELQDETCPEWEGLYKKVRKAVDNLCRHMNYENEVMYSFLSHYENRNGAAV
ncbi:hemerythrin domain-containing protein [Halobacteriovorax sp. GFR7]|uniref:hemerythrin domain-containing protein n=1 Tax=unclassified Halobacteriovorax TaxID=2639665 RepID=UPI003D96BD54